MPLIKDTLAQQIELSLKQRPQAAAAAAADWARAYVAYASSALSAAGSLPVTAPANQGALLSAFTSGFTAQAPPAAAASLAQGVILFWSAMVWTGPAAVGVTLSPGNASLAPSLAAIFADTSEQSEGDKARKFADAFDVGAKLVIVQDTPLVQPAPPIIGPIS